MFCSGIEEVGIGASRSSGHLPTATESKFKDQSAQTFKRDQNEEVHVQFPTKLYEMLEIVDSLGLSHTVSWLPEGRSFKVKHPDQFMALVVPQFFKFTQYRSFQRQLNLWDFRR